MEILVKYREKSLVEDIEVFLSIGTVRSLNIVKRPLKSNIYVNKKPYDLYKVENTFRLIAQDSVCGQVHNIILKINK